MTPQRRTNCAGSPQTAVAWLLVWRFCCSEISGGSKTIISAHKGLPASSAGWTFAMGEQPESTNKPVRDAAIAVANFTLRILRGDAFLIRDCEFGESELEKINLGTLTAYRSRDMTRM